MTDQEISRRLALAIGWVDADMYPVPGALLRTDPNGVWVGMDGNCWRTFGGWKKFDYRDPAVIWPIAERYKCFPEFFSSCGYWFSNTRGCQSQYGETAAKATALAVIAAAERGLLP